MEDEEVKRPQRISDEIVVNVFTEESAQLFRDQVMNAAKEDPMRPIIVYIDSFGGEMDALAKMIETMEEVPNPIVTAVIGKAFSAGAILLSCGDVRFCGKHSRVMIHETSLGAIGDVHDVSATSQEGKRMNQYFIGLLAKNCKIKGGYEALRKMIKDQDGRDSYMNAEQALKFGIVDAIGTPQIVRATLYQVEKTPPKRALMIPKKEDIAPSKTKKTKKSESKD